MMKKITLFVFVFVMVFYGIPQAQEITQTGMLSTTGYQAEGLDGAKNLEEDPVHQEVKQRIVELLEKQVETGQAVNPDEFNQTFSANLATDAEKTFKSYLADPIPATVSQLGGQSIHWSGFSAQLVFKTDQTTLEDLTYGYAVLPLSELTEEAKGWFPEDVTQISDVVCFYSTDTLNNYYIFWDRSSDQVFFKGLEVSGPARVSTKTDPGSES